VSPAARGHRGWWRAWWICFSASTDLGGWNGRRSPHFRSIGAALLLLLTLLLAGRGGEGLEGRMGATAAGGNPQSFSSNDGGVMEKSGKVTPAWRRGLPGSDLEAPSSNKLKTGRILDLGLGSPVMACPSLPQVLLCVIQVLPTGRGGEGKNGDDMPQPLWSSRKRAVEGIPPPGAVTSPARGPVLPAARVWEGASHPGGMPEHLPVSTFLLRAAILCLPPPIRGRFWEFDSGMPLLGGIGEEAAPAVPVRWTGS
jgi:hypothetical protein